MSLTLLNEVISIIILLFDEQLMNEAEYLKKNYGDWGGCYDSTLWDLHICSYDTKAEYNNCFIIHSK